MKIAQATVEHDIRNYKATVVVLDEGRRYTGTAANDEPSAALHAAYSSAVNEIREELRKTLSLKLDVSF